MAQRRVKKLLFDARSAGETIAAFTSGKSFEDYLKDAMLRSAVERQFEIIGEALRHAIDVDPELETKISETRRIVDFRNRLIHGYADISPRVVWGIIEEHLPRLMMELERLLAEME